MHKRILMAAPVFLVLGVLFSPAAFSTDVNIINVVLDADHFTPFDGAHDKTDGSIPLTWKGCKPEDVMSRLKKVKPDAVTAVPVFQGKEQLYGYLKLGNFEDNRFYFVMDVLAPDNMLMYFDYNKDGRLDNDGPPSPNKGQRIKPGAAGFATMLEVPWDKLIVDAPFKGVFKVWFFINNFQWAIKGFSHSSHTYLKGPIILNGVEWTIYLHDRAENDNDGDLTDDGLYIKVAEGKTRYITRQEAKDGAYIDGQLCQFKINYGKGR